MNNAPLDFDTTHCKSNINILREMRMDVFVHEWQNVLNRIGVLIE